MDSPGPPIPLEKLFAHREWVRRVARALVRDESLVDDLEQEVWLEALQRPPRSERSLKGWLAAVVRHNLLDRKRSESRRRIREEAVARPEAEKSAADLVAEAETLKRVVAAVLELEEPYRGTLLLRYFEDLHPVEVARRQGVPVETARTRVKRGIQLLREWFDARNQGDRAAWSLALLPFAGKAESTSPAAAGVASITGSIRVTGGILMGKKTLALTAAALLLLGGGWFMLRSGTPRFASVPMEVGQGGPLPATNTSTPLSTPASSQQPSPSLLPTPRCHLPMVIVDSAALPVAGARIEARPISPKTPYSDHILDPVDASVDPTESRTTARDGTATIPLPPGQWALTVRADGFGVGGALADLQEGATEDPLRVVLVPAASLGGIVLRAPGVPRPGVVVEARSFGNEAAHVRITAVADEAGNYLLTNLPSGSLILSARLPGGVARNVGAVEVPGTSRFDILLPGGVTVRGKVVDDISGLPIEGADLGISMIDIPAGLSSTGRTTSSRDGTFAFEDLPPGRMQSLSVRQQGYLSWHSGSVCGEFAGSALVTVLVPGSTLEGEVRLRRGAVVRGRVLLADGTPIPDASVSFAGRVFERGMMQLRESGNAISGPDGTYVVSCAYPGRGVARVEASGFCAPGAREAGMVGGLDPRWTVEVPVAGEVEKDLVLVRGATLEGTVVDARGAAVSGARVGLQDPWREEWIGPTVATGLDGNFRMVAAQPGSHRLFARGPGGLRGSSNRLTVSEDGALTGLRIVASPGAVLGGTVLGEDGSPVPGARVSIHVGEVALPGQQEEPARIAWARASGRFHPVGAVGGFRIEGLGAGTWTLHAMAPGRSPAFRTVKGVRGDSELTDIHFVLPAGKALGGRVVDSGGNPVAGIALSILPASSGMQDYSWTASSGTVTTDADGRFRQEGLIEGDHLLRVAVPGFAPHASVVPSGAEDVEVRLAHPLSIAGKVLLDGGGPAAGVMVTAFRTERVPGFNSSIETATHSDGTFRIEGLSAGLHGLYVGGFGGDVIGRKVEGVAAGTLDVTVTLARGLAIRGRLLDDRGLPVPNAEIRARGEGEGGSGLGRNGLTRTSEDGSFSLGGLLAGTYTVSTEMRDPRWSASAPVSGVNAGKSDLMLMATMAEPEPMTPSDGDLRIEGKVVLRGGGVPPAGTRVVAFPVAPAAHGAMIVLVSAHTDDRGGFLLDRLREGSYRIVAAWNTDSLAPGWLPTSTEAGDTGLVIEISPGMKISGRVVGASAGSVRWIRALPEGAPSGVFNWGEIDGDGHFLLGGLPEGPVRLQGILRAGGIVELGMANAPTDGVEVQTP